MIQITCSYYQLQLFFTFRSVIIIIFVSETRLHTRWRSALSVRGASSWRIHALQQKLYQIWSCIIGNNHDILEQLCSDWVSWQTLWIWTEFIFLYKSLLLIQSVPIFRIHTATLISLNLLTYQSASIVKDSFWLTLISFKIDAFVRCAI